MSICTSCHQEIPDHGRFCPNCGADRTVRSAVDPDATVASSPLNDPTLTSASGSAAVSTPSSNFGDEARFIPGAMVAGRYRIVGLLGRGGMGEVYRADDLKLGQPVALKFLPAGLEKNPDRMERFLSEVRTARQVTHPNVCRVYDIDEIDGQQFISMEYVDGEDLSSLLLRIGRLPQERAVEVARQICAGLAAAHDQGILHRDLKPANVMIDGRGRVRLTDFGLAALADQIGEHEVTHGTPAYMAPEQIAGREVTVRSDIYALGLVLYELFTGLRTFKADTAVELKHMHASAMPSSMTTHVSDLDPAVERAVLRCLEKDPADRPINVLAVSAALPGGDPLAAALAAGETPSPEMVAQAGDRSGMAPGRAIGLAVLVMAVFLVGSYWAGSMSVTNFLPLEKKPAVMEDRARSIIAELGYTEEVYTRPTDSAWGLVVWSNVINEVGEADTTGHPWEALRNRPDALSYWYRQSPRIMYPTPVQPPIFQRGAVGLTNPDPATAGEVIVLLDAAGNLRRFEVIPTRFSLADTVVEPDWGPLFRLAGLDPGRFTEDRPRYQRFMAPDYRRGWVGTMAERPEVELRVDAGSYEGRPVLFNVATAAGLVSLGNPPVRQEPDVAWYLDSLVQPLMILLVVVISFRFTTRNFKQGRVDRRGAYRIGSLAAMLFILGSAMSSHTIFTRAWAGELWPLVVGASFVGLAVWNLYLAAEPLGRQVWPTMFVSSNRLLSRPKIQWLDPLIGKSVLVGMLAGGVDFLIRGAVRRVLSPQWNADPVPPLGIDLSLLQGQRMALGHVFDLSLLLAFMFVFVAALVIVRRFVSRKPLALGITLLIWTFMNGAGDLQGMAFNLLTSIIMLVVILRWGVVAMVVSRIGFFWIWQARAVDWSAWYSQSAVLILAAIAALTAYGAWAAMGGHRERT